MDNREQIRQLVTANMNEDPTQDTLLSWRQRYMAAIEAGEIDPSQVTLQQFIAMKSGSGEQSQ